MLTLIRKIMKEVPDLKLAFKVGYQNTKIFLQSAISKVDLKMLLWLKKLKILCWGHTLLVILTLFRMGFFGAAHGRGGGKKPICTHILQWWNLAVTLYLKMIQKIYESRDTPPESRWHQQFFTGNQQILLYQEIHA